MKQTAAARTSRAAAADAIVPWFSVALPVRGSGRRQRHADRMHRPQTNDDRVRRPTRRSPTVSPTARRRIAAPEGSFSTIGRPPSALAQIAAAFAGEHRLGHRRAQAVAARGAGSARVGEAHALRPHRQRDLVAAAAGRVAASARTCVPPQSATTMTVLEAAHDAGQEIRLADERRNEAVAWPVVQILRACQAGRSGPRSSPRCGRTSSALLPGRA